MKNTFWWLALVVLVILVGAGSYYLWRHEGHIPGPDDWAESGPPPDTGLQEVPPAEPEIRHPIEQVPSAESSQAPEEGQTGTEAARPEPAPLPPLAKSDELVQERLQGLAGEAPVDELVHTDDILRRLVATVDNLSREKVNLKVRLARPVPGQFRVEGDEDHPVISPDNYARYAPWVRLIESVDMKPLVAAYVRLYPLLQEAYRDLGYPTGYFNDRLIEVIDELLATPEVDGPIRLVRPHVLYKFADPQLEALPAGQKLLLRMGPENAARVKAKLRALREQLAGEGGG